MATGSGRVGYVPRGATASAIAAEVERAVREGEIEVGERMPSIRMVASEAGVSPATVASAYRVLRQRGLLLTEGTRGMRVSARPTGIARPVLHVPAGVRDLCNGNPDPAFLPPLRWGMDEALTSSRLYGESTAYEPLLERSAADFASAGVDPGCQFVASGAMDAIERLLEVHLHPGDRVVVEDPTYAELLDLLRALQFDVVGVGVHDDGPDLEALAGALGQARCLIITPRAQNPTGAVLSASKADALKALLERQPEVLVIENDHSADGTPVASTAGSTDRWAVVRSVSKLLSPDLRLAVVAGDRATVNSVEDRQLLGAGWVSHILQKLTYRLWTDPRAPELLGRAATSYGVRRQALISALAGHGLAARGASGLNVYVEVREEATVAQSLLASGWAVRTGEGYRVESRTPFLRVTAATLTEAESSRFANDLSAITRSSVRSRRG